MKKISVLLFMVVFTCVSVNTSAETANKNQVMLNNTKGELHDFVKFVLESDARALYKYMKKKTVKKHLKKKKFPVALQISSDDQIEYIWGFIKNMNSYEGNLSRCIHSVTSDRGQKKSPAMVALLEKKDEYLNLQKGDETFPYIRAQIEEDYAMGYKNVYNQDFAFQYNASLIYKGTAIFQLYQLMKSSENYSKEELSNILKYGLFIVDENFMKRPRDVRPPYTGNLLPSSIRYLKKLIVVVSQKPIISGKFKQALSALENVQ